MAKKVAVINDLSGFGKCSLTAAIPVLSVMGIQCCPLPTAVLTGQTGYEHYESMDLTNMMPQYTDAWKKNHASFDGIYSGYLTGPEQITQVMNFLSKFRKDNTFLLVDPVMGDDGHVYGIYSEQLLDGMKILTAQANLITPNLMEACLLTGTSFEKLQGYHSVSDLLAAAKEVGHKLLQQANQKQDVVITGIKYHDATTASICNLAVTSEGDYDVETPFVPKSYSGTGDLFASILCGSRLNGYSTKKSIVLASHFLMNSIRDTLYTDSSTNDGVEFERHLGELIPKK